MKLKWHWAAINKRMHSGNAAQYQARITDHVNTWHWCLYNTSTNKPAFIGTAATFNAAKAAVELTAFNDANGLKQTAERLPKLGKARRTNTTWLQLKLPSPLGGSDGQSLVTRHPAKP